MFLNLLLVIIATSPVLTSVARDIVNSCSIDEFSCGNGTCVGIDAVCDGINQCSDGSDEIFCHTGLTSLSEDATLQRLKRNYNSCRKDQWQCRDRTCISFDGKCDGIIDCPDKSDETHALCRNFECQSNLFRCTYGACVDGTAPCNGKQECADNSDELLPRCRNETLEVRGQFKCSDGNVIPSTSRCDGVVDCPDRSDETVRTCAAMTCFSHLFQCAYGACVDQGADCNDVQDCADGSDESDELCNRTTTVLTTESVKLQDGGCVLPPHPEHGRYDSNKPNASPGEAFHNLVINVTCNQGYGLNGMSSVYCADGWWSEPGWWEGKPKCVRVCQLSRHESVEYRCQVPGLIEGFRICNEYEPTGTIANPVCKTPDFYSPYPLNFMRCRDDGNWNYIAKCSPECGIVTQQADGLLIGGWSAKRGEVSWHAGIYAKTSNPYMQICGGSIISNNVVISAAHCFWNNAINKQLPPSNYAVAVGKLYRPWNNPRDEAQKSDVSDVKIPDHYRGIAANYQADLAVVILITPIVFMPHVRPVCLSFDFDFERRQLIPGKIGKVAGWGLTGENDPASQVLKAVELPYIDVHQCIAESPPSFTGYITTDKFCAGWMNGTALCHGDSGGGLAFPETERGVQRYYLRGLVSTAPSNENDCNAYAYTSFTKLLSYEHFIKQYLTDF